MQEMQETWVWSLDGEDLLEEEMATREVPWIEEPGRLQSLGSQRVGPDWAHRHRNKEEELGKFTSCRPPLLHPSIRDLWEWADDYPSPVTRCETCSCLSKNWLCVYHTVTSCGWCEISLGSRIYTMAMGKHCTSEFLIFSHRVHR